MTTIEILREYRIGGFTLFDSGLTVLAVLLLSPLMTKLFRKTNLEIPLIGWLCFSIPLSVIAHIVFRQNTHLTQQILDPDGHYLAKTVVVALLIAGIALTKRIKR